MKLLAGLLTLVALLGITLTTTLNQHPPSLPENTPVEAGSFVESDSFVEIDSIAIQMVTIAEQFLQQTPESQQSTVSLLFDNDERTNWNFVPMPGRRKGLSLKEMSASQRRTVHTLLQSVLSTKGYLKATAIQQLERILAELEENPVYRDPELYYLSIFGTPSTDATWGWRFEGHHLSLNYSSIDNKIAVLPAFMGANPAEVRSGQFTGLRVLNEETDVARALMYAFSSAQRNKALISTEAPREIITGNAREAVLEKFEGLPYTEMTGNQQQLLKQLINVYASNLEPELAGAQWTRIEAAGIENIYFAWAGSLEENEAHYYRIHGPTVLIEYDNTQNGANHIHSAWRDLSNDFGRDLLRLHYDESSPDHGH